MSKNSVRVVDAYGRSNQAVNPVSDTTPVSCGLDVKVKAITTTSYGDMLRQYILDTSFAQFTTCRKDGVSGVN